LPPQHRTLDHRLFEDVSVAQQDPLMTQNANVVDYWLHYLFITGPTFIALYQLPTLPSL